jgi:hypothetical protein
VFLVRFSVKAASMEPQHEQSRKPVVPDKTLPLEMEKPSVRNQQGIDSFTAVHTLRSRRNFDFLNDENN